MTEQELLNEACERLKIEPIKLISVNKFRWILEDREGIGPKMIKLERLLQLGTKRPIDLRLQPKADKNKRFDRNYLRGVEKL